jgi:hypothetical protein
MWRVRRNPYVQEKHTSGRGVGWRAVRTWRSGAGCQIQRWAIWPWWQRAPELDSEEVLVEAI